MYRLRELTRTDIEEINKWRNNSEVIDNLGASFRYINLETDMQWFDYYMSHRNENVRCAIVNEEDFIIGTVSLNQIDYINQSALLNIMIGNSENRNKGAGTYALNKILEHAFFNMNLQRIELLVLENNAKAQHVYEKIGFMKEGIKKKARYKNGKFLDLYMYGLLKEKFINC